MKEWEGSFTSKHISNAKKHAQISSREEILKELDLKSIQLAEEFLKDVDAKDKQDIVFSNEIPKPVYTILPILRILSFVFALVFVFFVFKKYVRK
jgi:hypothetical protein